MKNKKGFTFIETLVVIGIVAILATTVVVAVNPTRRFEDARDKQREIHLQTILSAIERKTTIEAGWFDDENCAPLPQGDEGIDKETRLIKPIFKTIGNKRDANDTEKLDPNFYDLFDCLVPKYMVNELYDPDGGSATDTHYQIWQNPQTKYVTLRYVREKDPNNPIVAGAKKYFALRIPTVTTAGIKNITHTWAESGGNVTDDGDSSVSERGVVWHTHSNPTYTDNIGRTVDGSGTGVFENSHIHSLKPGTRYYVRAYAKNDIGVGYGEINPLEGFTTLSGAPAVSTDGSDHVTPETAELQGTILTIEFKPITAYFCWGESEAEANACVKEKIAIPSNITTPSSFSASLRTADGLEKNHTYCFKACGRVGTDFRCDDTIKCFTTETGPPYLETLSVEEKTSESAKVRGRVESYGGEPIIRRGFCYSDSVGNTCQFGANITCVDTKTNGGIFGGVLGSTDNGEFYANITGLDPGKTYSVCAFAENEYGGGGLSFGTPAKSFTVNPTEPRVSIVGVSAKASSADATIRIDTTGGGVIKQWGVCWLFSGGDFRFVDPKTSTLCTKETSSVKKGDNPNTTIKVYDNGLLANKSYDVKAYAINDVVPNVVGWSNDPPTIIPNTRSAEEPKLTTKLPTEEDTGISTLKNAGGTIIDHGGALISQVGACYSLTTDDDDPRVEDMAGGKVKCQFKTLSPKLNTLFSVDEIKGLTGDSPYYIQAFTLNTANKYGYGGRQFFKTDLSGPPDIDNAITDGNYGETWKEIGGKLISNGGDSATIVGVCYSTTNLPPPTYSEDNPNCIKYQGQVNEGASFTVTIPSLTPGVTYYARIFAVNNAGLDQTESSLEFKVGWKLGDPCTNDNNKCQSSYCADGVCCNEACNDPNKPCQTCGKYSSIEKGKCGYVNSPVQDPRDKCAQGKTEDDGCRADYCSGTSYSCSAQTLGDGGCPVCQRCTDSDVECDYYTDNTQDVGCDGTCQACHLGVCGYAYTNTDPGEKCTYTYCNKGFCNASHACDYVLNGYYKINDNNIAVRCWDNGAHYRMWPIPAICNGTNNGGAKWWGSQGFDNPSCIGDGETNSACKYCDDLSWYYDDWYLPTPTQLLDLYTNRTSYSIENTTVSYWSSNQYDVYYAYYVTFNTGGLGFTYKHSTQRLRCVRGD